VKWIVQDAKTAEAIKASFEKGNVQGIAVEVAKDTKMVCLGSSIAREGC
jgi:hypothetical protein